MATEERLRVANKSLEANLTLLDQTKAQYDVGVVSRVEVVEAEAGVAERELNRIREENFYRTAQDTLINLVLGPNLTPDSTLEIQPTTIPDVVQYDVDAEAATAKAYENRPELAIAKAEVESRTLNLKFANNQRLPQVDAVGTYGYNGLAGRTSSSAGHLREPPHADPGHRPALRQRRRRLLQQRRGPELERRRGLLDPPRQRHRRGPTPAGRSSSCAGRATRVRREEQDIVLEVRDAIRNLLSAQRGHRGRRAARAWPPQEQFRAESIRLEHGESTPFDVLQREEDLVDAESQKIAALQIYRNSLAALDRAQGTILRDRNVIVEQARTLR